MLALLDPSQLPLCRAVTLTALPLLQHLFQHYSDSPKTWSWAIQTHTSAWGGQEHTGSSA